MSEHDEIAVAVIMGGISTEHDISLKSGENVVNALLGAPYKVLPVVISKEAEWLVSKELLQGKDHTFTYADYDGFTLCTAADALQLLYSHEIDVAFIALHGKGGEDGQLQGFLQTAGIPFTGSGVLGNAICMDKVLTKRALRDAGLPVAADIVLECEVVAADLESATTAVIEAIGLPCVVKISDQGSSHNVSMVSSREELTAALEAIHPAGRQILIEEFIKGRELTCAVIDSTRHGRCLALPPTELIPVESDWFDFHAKYTPGATDEITPAEVSDEITAELQRLARCCHQLLHCSGMSRTDMFMRENGELVVIEVNTIPGLTETSLIPQAAAVDGIDFLQLLRLQIDWALHSQ